MTAERLPGALLRLTGIALFAGGIALYLDAGYSVLALVLLLIAPDLSLVGFAAGPRAGSVIYNIGHALPLALAIGAAGALADWDAGIQIGLAWSAHIGIDWALGYGWKYPTGFQDTHVQRAGGE